MSRAASIRLAAPRFPRRESPSVPTPLLRKFATLVAAACVATAFWASAGRADDPMRELQSAAVRAQSASWGRWGNKAEKYSSWTNHSNRLIPVYTFGLTLDSWRTAGSPYADADRLASLYGTVPAETLNPTATYFDQTQIHDLMFEAVRAGKRHIIILVFDGMDWQTTRAAAIYAQGADQYDSGRGTGLAIQDYRGVETDFAFVVTSPRLGGAKPDVDAQTIRGGDAAVQGGFSAAKAGPLPWEEMTLSPYPIGLDRQTPHEVTDSAASATSLFAGIKTYNGSINVAVDGSQAKTIAHELQADGWRVGAVSSVPVSHATPGSAYAHNVSRSDYQDIARDMIGVPSVSHRGDPLPGLDVLIGGGFGEGKGKDNAQGENFMPGNQYLHESDVERAQRNGYVFATRTPGRPGAAVLDSAADWAATSGQRLLGLFGVQGGHLPFQTADGDYVPTFDIRGAEKYSPADLLENPTLADMTRAALRVLGTAPPAKDSDADDAKIPKFWLAIEAGDVDWANHSNNLDNSIGAVLSGDAAFTAVTDWVDANQAWDDSVVIVTSDHGHYLVLEDVAPIADAGAARAEQ